MIRRDETVWYCSFYWRVTQNLVRKEDYILGLWKKFYIDQRFEKVLEKLHIKSFTNPFGEYCTQKCASDWIIIVLDFFSLKIWIN